jgi:hypothetical protein
MCEPRSGGRMWPMAQAMGKGNWRGREPRQGRQKGLTFGCQISVARSRGLKRQHLPLFTTAVAVGHNLSALAGLSMCTRSALRLLFAPRKRRVQLCGGRRVSNKCVLPFGRAGLHG